VLRSSGALVHERAWRLRIQTLYTEIYTGSLDSQQRAQRVASVRELQDTALAEYRQLAPIFRTLLDAIERGGGVAISLFLIDWFSAVMCAAFFTHLLLAAYIAMRTARESNTTEATLVCCGLLSLWFPLRLYAEWYANFYTFRSLREYFSFWALVGIATIGMLLAAIILKPTGLTVSLAAFGSILAIVFAIMAKLRPETTAYGAVIFEQMPFY